MKSNSVVAALLLTALLPVGAFANEDTAAITETSAGARVRVGTRDGKHVEGILKSWESRAVTIAQPGANDGEGERTLAIDPASIERLDRSIGEKGHGATGAAIGAAVGLVPLAFGVLAPRDKDYPGLGPLLGVIYSVVAVPVGAVLGAVIGHNVRSDAWERVDLKETKKVSAALSVQPVPGRGVGAGLSLSWK